jgi:hypothetical protein
VGEWLKPAVLKTVRPQKGLVGSNPTPSASQSQRFSLSVPFGPKFRFCGPKGPNIVRIRAFDFSERRKTASIGLFFSEAVSSSAFSRSEGNRQFESGHETKEFAQAQQDAGRLSSKRSCSADSLGFMTLR